MEEKKHEALVVNIFAGPGAGKSTLAADVFARLKAGGANAELVTEFAKDLVWEGMTDALDCQLYVTGVQAWRIRRLLRRADVVVTDSPVLLGAVYAREPGQAEACREEFRVERFRYDVLLDRKMKFDPRGRRHTEAESRRLDDAVLSEYLKELEWERAWNVMNRGPEEFSTCTARVSCMDADVVARRVLEILKERT